MFLEFTKKKDIKLESAPVQTPSKKKKQQKSKKVLAIPQLKDEVKEAPITITNEAETVQETPQQEPQEEQEEEEEDIFVDNIQFGVNLRSLSTAKEAPTTEVTDLLIGLLLTYSISKLLLQLK